MSGTARKLCFHRNVIESTSGDPNRRDDRLTHWRCLDCNDRFPLIGDTGQWKPRPANAEESPTNVGLYDPDGRR